MRSETDLPPFAAVFDRAAADYDRGVEFFAPLGAALVAGAGLASGDRVLDVGCGRGACTLPAAEAVRPTGSAVGIDLAPGMLAEAAAETAARGLGNVAYARIDAADPGFPADSFDAVTAGFSVFFLRDPPAALRRYLRLLRPGGRLAMSSYGADDPRFFQVTDVFPRFLPGDMPPMPGRTEGSAFRTRAGVARLVAEAGFTGVRVAEHDVDMVFPDRAHWWDWLWTTAGRMIMELIPPERLPAARAAAYAEMDRVRAATGRLAIRWNVYFTYAVRPDAVRPDAVRPDGRGARR